MFDVRISLYLSLLTLHLVYNIHLSQRLIPFNRSVNILNSHHPSTLSAPVQHLRFHLQESHPTVILDILYCPGLPLRSEAISHTLYRGIVTMNERVQREGRNAPLTHPYTTPQERGYNCLFMIEPNPAEAALISVGVALEVVQFLRTWMVREQHLGSTAIVVYVDEIKAAVGGVRPIVDQALLSA